MNFPIFSFLFSLIFVQSNLPKRLFLFDLQAVQLFNKSKPNFFKWILFFQNHIFCTINYWVAKMMKKKFWKFGFLANIWLFFFHPLLVTHLLLRQKNWFMKIYLLEKIWLKSSIRFLQKVDFRLSNIKPF